MYIKIDQERCIRCGQCAHVCPFSSLRAGEDGKIQYFPELCIRCMHCGAICPRDAITGGGEPASLQLPVRTMDESAAAMVEQAIYQRRSYRKFQKAEVPDGLIEKAIAAGHQGASAKNQHPCRWTVIKSRAYIEGMRTVLVEYLRQNRQMSPEVLEEMARGNDPVFGSNATILLVTCDSNAINAFQDSAIAVTNAELILQGQGVGTCWAGYLARFCRTVPALKALLGLPEGEDVYAALMIGYPDHQCFPKIPARPQGPEITYIR